MRATGAQFAPYLKVTGRPPGPMALHSPSCSHLRSARYLCLAVRTGQGPSNVAAAAAPLVHFAQCRAGSDHPLHRFINNAHSLMAPYAADGPLLRRSVSCGLQPCPATLFCADHHQPTHRCSGPRPRHAVLAACAYAPGDGPQCCVALAWVLTRCCMHDTALQSSWPPKSSAAWPPEYTQRQCHMGPWGQPQWLWECWAVRTAGVL